MSEKLSATTRTEFGKGAARRIRRDNKVPAVLYGHGIDPIHITLPGHDAMMALKHGGANALLEIDVEGDAQLALPKQVQRHPVRGEIEHLDLLVVRRGEKVVVNVPVVVTGEAGPDTLVNLDSSTISLLVEATHIPESIEISVEGAEAGLQVLAHEVRLPEGATLDSDDELLIVAVVPAPTMALEDEDAEGEGAEGEDSEAAEGSDGDEAAAEGGSASE